MKSCVVKLLKVGTEEKLEYLCELLTTVGERMEKKTNVLPSHFQTMQQIALDENQSNKISSRVRSMLLDVIELRKNKWVLRRTEMNPMRMGQIQG